MLVQNLWIISGMRNFFRHDASLNFHITVIVTTRSGSDGRYLFAALLKQIELVEILSVAGRRLVMPG